MAMAPNAAPATAAITILDIVFMKILPCVGLTNLSDRLAKRARSCDLRMLVMRDRKKRSAPESAPADSIMAARSPNGKTRHIPFPRQLTCTYTRLTSLEKGLLLLQSGTARESAWRQTRPLTPSHRTTTLAS